METYQTYDRRYRNWSCLILVVDDMPANRRLVRDLLPSPEFDVIEASDGLEAIKILAETSVDLVLLDIMMPKMDGLETVKYIRTQLKLELLPILMVSALAANDDIIVALQLGADDYICKPYNAAELLARVRVNVERKRLTDHLDDTESVLFSLARMVEARDEDTGNHCDRLAHYGVVFGQKLGLSYPQIEGLRRGGVLHDIGKLGIPDSILLKKGSFTPPEWEIMKRHTTIGASLCQPLKTMVNTVDIIRCHHERWDGSGYPEGLKGEEIPLLARIFQVVDIYDALSSERPYKPAYSTEKVISIMREESARGFWQPDLVESFLDIVINEPEKLIIPEKKIRDRSASVLDYMFANGVMDWYKTSQED